MSAYDPNKIKSIRALNDHVIVTDMNFDQKISHGGIIIPTGDRKLEGIHARWARVYAVERYRMIRGLVSRYLTAESEKRAEAFDRGLHPRTWEIGDKVFRKESRGVASKFLPRNTGPYRVGQILSSHKVVLMKPDGEVAFSYPVPIAELIYVPERDKRSIELDLSQPATTRSLGGMLRTAAAPVQGTKSRFAGIGVGAYVVYQPPVARSAKSVVVGRVTENVVESAILKLNRYDGAWGHTRVRWTRTEHHDTPRYAQVVREVALHRDGAISYGDLRALE